MANIINFEDVLKKSQKQSEEQSVEHLREDVLITSIFITKQLLELIAEDGFEVYDEEYAHDIAMVVEAIKGLLYNSVGVRFPTQHLARILFTIQDKEDFIESFLD